MTDIIAKVTSMIAHITCIIVKVTSIIGPHIITKVTSMIAHMTYIVAKVIYVVVILNGIIIVMCHDVKECYFRTQLYMHVHKWMKF